MGWGKGRGRATCFSIPAVSRGGAGSRGPVDVVADRAHELDQGLGGLGHAVVGPHRVVELPHQPGVGELVLLGDGHVQGTLVTKGPHVSPCLPLGLYYYGLLCCYPFHFK